MHRKFILLSFFYLGILVFLLYPKFAFAEIATVRDWIGIFPDKLDDYRKTATLTSTPSASFPDDHAWAYTSSCTQTPGTVPQLSRNGTPVPCTFTLNPAPIPDNCYMFRLFANDGSYSGNDAVIAEKRVCAGTDTSPPPPAPVGKLYHIKGDLTVNSNITVNKTGAIFVDGNLYINTDLTNTNPKTGIVFVVQGSIYIRRDVETVNAFLISHGKDASSNDITPFCSAWNGTIPPNPDGSDCVDYPDPPDPDAALRQYLIINGSVISLNATLSPQFVRRKVIRDTNPSETINFEPKYVIILKDVFSRDLKIWREIQ